MAIYTTSVEQFARRRLLLWAAFLGLAPITMMVGMKLQTPIRKFVRFLNRHAKGIVEAVRHTTRRLLTSSSSTTTKEDDPKNKEELLSGTGSSKFETETTTPTGSGSEADTASASRSLGFASLSESKTMEKASTEPPKMEPSGKNETSSPDSTSRSAVEESEPLVAVSAADDSSTPTPEPTASKQIVVLPPPFMLAHMPTKEYGLQLFDDLDKNNNQMLSFEELGTIYTKLFGKLPHKTPRMKAYLAADQNSDGFLKRDEYEVFLRYTVYYNNCWEAFAIRSGSETNHVSQLSREQFVEIAPALLGSQVVEGADDPEKLFDLMDANHSERLSYGEFCTWMARNTCQWGDTSTHDTSSSSMSRSLKMIVGYGHDTKPQETEGTRLRSTSATSATSTVGSTTSGQAGSRRALTKPSTPQSTTAIKKMIHVPSSMAKNLPSKEDALRLFDELDRDKNEMLSLKELGKVWKRIFPKLEHKASVTKAYKAADENADGFIKRNEFEAFLRYVVYYDEFWDVFVIGDRRRKGHASKMSRKEFVKVAARLGIVDGEDPNKIFDMMDDNHSRAVTYTEYCTWMARHTCEWGL